MLLNIVWLLWILTEVIGAGILPGIKRSGVPNIKGDRGSGYLIFAATFLSIVLAYYYSIFGIVPAPLWLCYPGILLMFLGILVRQWSILVLGRYFSMQVQIQDGHKIIETGPYRLIRHPSYSGGLLTMLGMGLALHTWAAELTSLILFILAFSYRIYVEEIALTLAIGRPYTEYMKRTKRLIPFIY